MTPGEPAPRQTLGYLRNLFESRGLRPKSKLGQCFLIDINLLELLLRTAALSRADLVLEVGAGSGSLTARLGDLAGAVLAIEIDAGFYELALENTAAYPNVAVVHADVLKNKNQIHPRILDALHSMAQAEGIRRTKLVANLPYVVATPVITNLLLGDVPFERMVVTVQWEMAERLSARPSTKDYGALAVLVQSLADVEIIRRLRPAAFWPRPKVDSAIVLLRPRAERWSRIADLDSFHSFVRGLYLHRRKNLRGALHAHLGKSWTKQEVDERLGKAGFSPYGRAEALSVEEHQRLWMTMTE